MTRQQLIKKVDLITSMYIRKKYPNCYTCPARTDQCGHYMGRKNMATRYLADNLRGQCAKCNMYNHGEPEIFRKNLVVELGEERVKEIEQLSKQETHFSFDELLEIYKNYKNLAMTI